MTDEELNAKLFEFNKQVFLRFIRKNLSEKEIDGMLEMLEKIRNETDNPRTSSDAPVSGDSPYPSE
jgi:hypothetical protein